MIVPIVGVLAAVFVVPPPWGPVLLIGVVVWELGEKFLWIRLISRYPVSTGREALIGLPVTATTFCRPLGRVRLRGETWQARCSSGARPGETLVVQGVDLITLIVERQHPRTGTADVGATSQSATDTTAGECPRL
jgi:membrane protein implicated in regulation of membrane protease activity